MRTTKEPPVNTALWIVQGILAAFLMAGMLKLAKGHGGLLEDPRNGWVNEVSVRTAPLAGTTEIIGATLLLVPWAINIVPILTPFAATGLAVQMALAAPIHSRRWEMQMVGMNVMLGVGAAFVAWGRLAG